MRSFIGAAGIAAALLSAGIAAARPTQEAPRVAQLAPAPPSESAVWGMPRHPVAQDVAFRRTGPDLATFVARSIGERREPIAQRSGAD